MLNEKQFERLITVAYRLPFKFIKSKDSYKAVQNSGGLVSAILALAENFKKSINKLVNNKIAWSGIGDNLTEAVSSEMHDYFIRKAREAWKFTISADTQWKEVDMPILLEYVNRYNGTFV